jgi:hypothetical protein
MVEAQPPREWEPTQVVSREPVDLRFAALGPKGYKIRPVKSRKRGREEVEDAGPVPMEHDEAMDTELPKRQRVEGEAYRKVCRCDSSIELPHNLDVYGCRLLYPQAAEAAAWMMMLPFRSQARSGKRRA